jgi:UDP-glucose 4-epimerase
MKKILITGASGYIGTCLFKYLINKKFNVYGTDKKKFFLKNYAKRFYKGNLNNKFFLSKVLLLLKPDLIIHLAGESTLDGIKKKKIIF